MTELEALLPLLPASGRGLVSLVGAGGKTRLLSALAAQGRAAGFSVLATTTTAMYDPRSSGLPAVDRLVTGTDGSPPAAAAPAAGELVFLAEGVREGGKVTGPSPERLSAWWRKGTLGASLVLVEADGARGHPLKAPAAHEPALPEASDLVIGCLGLAALGRAVEEAFVHRLEAFCAATGLARGQTLGPAAYLALAASPEGLFKRCPPGARRLIYLGQADLVSPAAAEALALALTGAGGRATAVLLSGRDRPPRLVLPHMPSEGSYRG